MPHKDLQKNSQSLVHSSAQPSLQPLSQSSAFSPALSAWINPKYLEPKSIAALKHEFETGKPYKYLEASEFFLHHRLVEVLKAMLEEKFYFKESDLFKFNQTQDLKNTDSKIIKEFITFLYSKEFIAYMQHLTNFKFSKTVDIAGTLYEDTNFLLCHDDQLDDRKIAFLCYLSTVEETDGGSLALYNAEKTKLKTIADDKKEKETWMPTTVAKRIYPAFNKLAFFEVSEISFHEVEEVITPETKRVAIGGWFYEQH